MAHISSRGFSRLCEKPLDSTPGVPDTPNPVGAFVESHGPPKKQSTAVAQDFFGGAIFVAAFGCAIFGDRFGLKRRSSRFQPSTRLFAGILFCEYLSFFQVGT